MRPSATVVPPLDRTLRFAVLGVAALLAGGVPGLASAGQDRPPVDTMVVEDAADASLELSRRFHADDDEDTALLASGDALADVVIAAPLGSWGWPLILAPAGRITDDVTGELERALGPGPDWAGGRRTIHVIGGTAVVPDASTERLEELGYTVERHAGPDRIGTSLATVNLMLYEWYTVGGQAPWQLVASAFSGPDGRGLVDAIFASGWANGHLPLVLSPGDVPDPRYVECPPGRACTEWDSTLIGGPAVLSPEVAEAMGEIDRVAGATRYETQAKVLEQVRRWRLDDPQPQRLFVVADDAPGRAIAAVANSHADRLEAVLVLAEQSSSLGPSGERLVADYCPSVEVLVLGPEPEVRALADDVERVVTAECA